MLTRRQAHVVPGLRVLVVDDYKPAREGLAIMLRYLGCQVETASSAEQAIRSYLGDAYDLVTLDFRMPGLDGVELHRILSQEFGVGRRTVGPALRRLTPILFVTAYGDDPRLARQRYGEAVVGVLAKPIVLEELESVLAALPVRQPGARPSTTTGLRAQA